MRDLALTTSPLTRTRTMFAIRHKRLDRFYSGVKPLNDPNERRNENKIWHFCGRRYETLEYAQSAVEGIIAARVYSRVEATRLIEIVEVQERITKSYLLHCCRRV